MLLVPPFAAGIGGRIEGMCCTAGGIHDFGGPRTSRLGVDGGTQDCDWIGLAPYLSTSLPGSCRTT